MDAVESENKKKKSLLNKSCIHLAFKYVANEFESIGMNFTPVLAGPFSFIMHHVWQYATDVSEKQMELLGNV